MATVRELMWLETYHINPTKQNGLVREHPHIIIKTRQGAFIAKEKPLMYNYP